MTTLPLTPRRRGATLLAAGLVAGSALLTAMVTAAEPALADPSPQPSSSAPASTPASTPGAAVAPVGSITWSVQPSTADGPDKRSAFTYTNLKPGTIVHDYMGVTNFSKMPVTFQIYASDAFNTATGTLDLLPASAKPTDVGSWVSLPRASVTIEPGARVNEPFTLTVPANAGPGDHTGGLIAAVSTTTGGSGGNVSVDRRIAVPVYLRVSGALAPAVAIESVSVSYHGTLNPFGGGGTDVSYTVHNTGNARLDLSQGVSATGLFGIKLGDVRAAALTDLLPGATYRVSQHLAGVFPLGPLSAHVHLEPSEPAGLPRADPAPVQVSHDADVWATPWPQLLLLLLVVGLIFGIRWWVRWGRRRTARTVAAAVERARRETVEQLTAPGAKTPVGAKAGDGAKATSGAKAASGAKDPAAGEGRAGGADGSG